MAKSGILPNGQVYYLSEKHAGLRTKPSRRPSKKAKRKWRRMLRRRGITAEQLAERIAAAHKWERGRYVR